MKTSKNNLISLLVFSTLAAMSLATSLASDEINRVAAEYPATSPDGSKLVYTLNAAGNRDLWIANANGANATILAPWRDSDEKQPSWAPNGSRIVFSSTRNSAKHNIWTITPGGSDAQQLTFDDAEHEQPRYSPDGSFILYLSNDTGKKELWVMNADGSAQRSVALISARISDPAWSPDGLQIVYVGCRRGGACNLFRINANGSGGLQITSGEFQDWNPDWSTQGILFASNRGGSQGLWLVQPDGTGLQQVTAPSGVADLDPRWIKGTSGFVFTRSGKTVADAASDIWSVASLGTTAQQLTKSFNTCLQDESNGNIFLFNSVTGQYQFTRCGIGSLTLIGVGTVTVRGSVISLQHYATDRRIVVTVDNGIKSGTASIQMLSAKTTFTINDRNTADDSCGCS